MPSVQTALSHARHLHWYLSRIQPVPLVSELDDTLPLSCFENVRIAWPNRYSWKLAGRRLDVIKRAFQAMRHVTVEPYDVDCAGYRWHEKGGFPTSARCRDFLGAPGFPKGPYDIRGEVFEVHHEQQVYRVAYDYSDYPVVSDEVLDQVDFYFKAVTTESLPAKVHSIGVCASDYRLLGQARSAALKNIHSKRYDVYGRFGRGTDGQSVRERVLKTLEESRLNLTGGFELLVHAAYLKELMRARVALELPGQGPWSYRLAESMALGAVVVAPRCVGVAPEQLVDGLHYVSISSDGSDVVDKCEQLLADRDCRDRICAAAGTFFDRNFSPQSKARRVLRTVLRLPADGCVGRRSAERGRGQSR